MLKAFISNNCPEVRLIRKDKTSKSFEECLSHVSSMLGKEFRVVEENLKKLYDYRCHIIHFYKDKIDIILYALLHRTILFYHEFSKTHFNIDLAEETNLILLPIGFKPFVSPIDFLSKKSDLEKSSIFVRKFIEDILTSTQILIEEGIEESIFTTYKMAVINEKRITNADIIAGITKNESESKLSVPNILANATITSDENAKKIFIEEESLYKTKYTLTYGQVTEIARSVYSDFKQNPKFNRIMKGIKGNPNIHKVRYLDINNKTGAGKDYYSQIIFQELDQHYTKIKEPITECLFHPKSIPVFQSKSIPF